MNCSKVAALARFPGNLDCAVLIVRRFRCCAPFLASGLPDAVKVIHTCPMIG